MRELKASVTIEAAIMIPMVLVLFAVIMKLGIQLYSETRELADEILNQQLVNAVELFREAERMRELF